MTASTAFINIASEVAPTASDVAIGIHMYGDAVFRKLSGQVLGDTLRVGLSSIDEAKQIQAEEDSNVDIELNTTGQKLNTQGSTGLYIVVSEPEYEESRTITPKRTRKLGTGVYYSALGVYTGFDDSITAPAYRAVSKATNGHTNNLIEYGAAPAALVAMSGGMAFGLGMIARARKSRHTNKPEEVLATNSAETIKPYSAQSFTETTAIGVPLRVQLGELTKRKDIAAHALYYATIGQAVMYAALDKVGATNGMFFGGIASYVAYKMTKDMYYNKNSHLSGAVTSVSEEVDFAGLGLKTSTGLTA